MMRRADLAGAAGLAAIGIFGLVTGLRYGVGEVTEPGPGLMPAVAGGMLLALALVIAVSEALGAAMADAVVDEDQRAHNALWRVIGYAVGIFGFALLMEPIGTLPTIVLFFLWIVRGVERQSWRLTLALTAGATVGVWLLFVKALKVTLPMVVG
jgi:putative tricarboxylic transport membrane protein